MKKKKVITTTAAVALALSSMVPALAATKATAPDPTAAQVAQGLLSVYATQQVWPKGLITAPLPGQKHTPRMNWANNATPSPRSAWVGLSTVFPGQPASQYAQDLGMTNVPQDQPITAGTLAQWLLNWQLTARIPKELQYQMKYQPTQDPYTLMSDYSFFYGTNFKGRNTVVNAHDLAMVEKNIVDVDQCYRVLGKDKIELLRPMTMVWGYGKNASITLPAQSLQEVDHTILSFEKNRVIVDPTVVLSPFTVNSLYFKNLASGIDGASTYTTVKKSGQKVTVDAFLTKKNTGHFQPSEAETDDTGEFLPASIGFNKPFVLFGLGGAGFTCPQYYITFSQGRFSGIYVDGFIDNNWPSFEIS